MRSRPHTDAVRFEGYAALFGQPDMAGDVLYPGFFSGKGKKLIPVAPCRVMMLYQHSPDRIIGRWEKISEDNNGLFVQGHITNATRDSRDVAGLVIGGFLTGLSIGFKPRRTSRRREGGRIFSLWTSGRFLL